MLVVDPMSCFNCEPLYCRGCLLKIKQAKCPTCNQDKNFSAVNLKLKNMLMDLRLKGCPVSPNCQFANEPMSYQQLTRHLTHECLKVKGYCSFNCGATALYRNEMPSHIE
jgi:hypothetical protein